MDQSTPRDGTCHPPSVYAASREITLPLAFGLPSCEVQNILIQSLAKVWTQCVWKGPDSQEAGSGEGLPYSVLVKIEILCGENGSDCIRHQQIIAILQASRNTFPATCTFTFPWPLGLRKCVLIPCSR